MCCCQLVACFFIFILQVMNQTPWDPDQFEVMCCVFQLAEWGVLNLQATSQTPWDPAQFEVMCCVLFQLAEQGVLHRS